MLDVFFTVDVEVWCGGWENIDEKFPASFQRYVYGKTPQGDYGLPYQLHLLKEHNLLGVFFVEPLFAARFGLAPLEEIVGLLQQGGQEVQLHMHTEWVNEAKHPILPDVIKKRQFMRHFSLAEQQVLIATGVEFLAKTGGGKVNAFRAGSFAFDANTLVALAANGIDFDSSYNATMMGLESGVMPGIVLYEPIECSGVYEYPMTVYKDSPRSLRHVQLGACSYREIEHLLWQALKTERKAFVILSHNFELLSQAQNRPDKVVVERMRKLCRLFDQHRDCFRLRGFKNLLPSVTPSQPPPLSSPLWATGIRVLEQLNRRLFY